MSTIRSLKIAGSALALTGAAALCGMTLSAMPTASAATAPASSLPITSPAPAHVVIVMMENEAYSNVVGDSTDAPYINGTLIPGGESLTNAHGETHPSLPNYYDLMSGSTQGLTTSTPPAAGSVNADNLPNELASHGFSFADYSDEATPAAWLRFQNLPGTASSPNPVDKWLTCPSPTAGQGCGFPTTAAGYAALPTVTFVHGNPNESMHGNGGANSTNIANGDTWLKNTIDGYAQWAKANNSLLVVTWDEDLTDSAYNTVPEIYYGAGITAGSTSSIFTNHLNLLRDLETWYGLPHLGMSATGSGRVSAYSSTCLDDSGSGTANGNHIILWGCTGGSNQTWTLNGDGTVGVFGKCMDVSGSGTAAGTVVQLWTCNGSIAQQWEAEPNGMLRNPHANLCLDDPSGTKGQQLVIEPCSGTTATQQFHLPV